MVLYVRFGGLADGYTDAETVSHKLVANSFCRRMTWPDTVVHPLEVVAGPEGSLDRMHRSGDFSRCLPDNIVERSGCADDLVKTHGFRTASGVIDMHLREHAG